MAAIRLSADPKLDAVLQRVLDGDEQRRFAAQFGSLWQAANGKTDFVIDLEDVYEWLGFPEKRDAERALVGGNLEEGVHFKTAPVAMTVHGFKRFCMSVKTERAETVRDCCLALEDALFDHNREALESERAEKEALRVKFDTHVENTNRVLKDTLDTAQAVLDGYVDRCQNMLSTGMGAKIREIIRSVPRDDESPDPVPDYVVADEKAAAEKAARLQKIHGPKVPAPLPDFEPVVAVNPGDYDAFIAERCEIRADAYTLPAELSGAHRLWGRCSDEHVRKGLFEYLRKRFPRSKKEYDDKSLRLAHVGVALKPRPTAIPEPSPTSTDVERFLHAECREDDVGRVAMNDLLDRFEAWKRAEGGNREYQICPQDRRRIEEHMSPHFLWGTPVTEKGVAEYGYFGLVFKDDVARVGYRDNNNLRKRVMVLDPATSPASLLKVFDSMQACAAWFGTVPSTISMDIRFNRMRKGLVIKKVTDDDAELVKKYDPDASPSEPPGLRREKTPGTGQWRRKAVEEVDAKTGEVVQVFDTVKDAAEEACVEPARMSTIIARGGKLGHHYYRFAKPDDSPASP